MFVRCVELPLMLDMYISRIPAEGDSIEAMVDDQVFNMIVTGTQPAKHDTGLELIVIVNGLKEIVSMGAKACNNIAVEAVKVVEATNIIEYDEYVLCEWCDQKATGNSRWQGDDKLHDSCGRTVCHGYDFEKYASMKAVDPNVNLHNPNAIQDELHCLPFVSGDGVGEMAKALRKVQIKSAGMAQERIGLQKNGGYDLDGAGRILDRKVEELKTVAADQAMGSYRLARKFAAGADANVSVWKSIVENVMCELGFNNGDIVQNIQSGRIWREGW